MVQNGPNDHFGQNDLIPNWILIIRETNMDHFGPFWLAGVHFGPFRSANRTLAIPEIGHQRQCDTVHCENVTYLIPKH